MVFNDGNFDSGIDGGKVYQLLAKRNKGVVQVETLRKYFEDITDCFLSHDWGEGNKNHDRVGRMNKLLKEKGLKTWYDTEKITGQLDNDMYEGILSTRCALVFITSKYIEKVDGRGKYQVN